MSEEFDSEISPGRQEALDELDASRTRNPPTRDRPNVWEIASGLGLLVGLASLILAGLSIADDHDPPGQTPTTATIPAEGPGHPEP